MPRTSTHLWPLLTAALLCAGLVVVPGAWQAAIPGLRYSTATTTALALVALACASLALLAPQRRASWRFVWLLAALVAVKVLLSHADAPMGWRAEYATMTPAPPKVGGFSWRIGYRPYRIDQTIAFDSRTFELQFFNDFHRYNGRDHSPPRATTQELRVVWTGWFDAGELRRLTVNSTASGRISTRLDGRAWFSNDDNMLEGAPMVDVPAGRHRLDVIYDKPAGRAPAASVAFALDGAALVPSPWPITPGGGSFLARYLSDGLVVSGLALLAVLFVTGLRDATPRGSANVHGVVVTLLTVSWLLYKAVAHADAFNGATYEFTPGDDHLAYEGLSRNILEEGLLMPEHRPIGQGTPFFFYPLYSYVLAGAHLLLGDSHATVVFVNAAAAAALPVLFWLLGWRRLPTVAQAAGQLLLVAFVARHHTRYFESPLTDNLFIPLIVATLVLAARALRTRRTIDIFITGCAVAACATTRPSAFLLIPMLAALLAWKSAGPGVWHRALPIGALAAGYAAALAPVIARNWIVARQAVAMVTLSHAIPISLIPPEAQTPEFLKRAALWTWSASLQLAGQMIAADPWGVAWLEVRKVLFTLGVTSLGPTGSQMIWDLPFVALAGIVAFALQRVPAATAAVLLTFLASHFAAIVIAYPWTYGYKTILPVHLVFLFAAVHLFGRPRTAAETQDAAPTSS